MNTDLLKTFLIQANKEGYAAGESKITKNEDHSYTSQFESGDLKLHDSWFGGEPFGGREVVFFKGNPHWMMVYYGQDTGKAEGLIPFLRKAMMSPDQEMPLRGPNEMTEGDFQYKNSATGDLERFIGEEKIFYKGEEVFRTNYVGGLVDKREDQM